MPTLLIIILVVLILGGGGWYGRGAGWGPAYYGGSGVGLILLLFVLWLLFGRGWL